MRPHSGTLSHRKLYLKSAGHVDPRKGQVVEMRFFGGLTNREVAEVLQVSEETVIRGWRLAKVWLLRELGKKSVDA